MWCLGIEQEDIKAIMDVQRMIDTNVLQSDCTVQWYKIVPYLTGRELKGVRYEKIRILKGIKERTPVFFQKDPDSKKGHWVGVENGKIGFNPLAYSVNVEEGRPTKMRVLIL